MANTTKPLSTRDGSQTLQASFNEVNSSITTDSFLVGKVGRKVTQTILTTSIANDTTDLEFSESGVALYTIRVIYTNGTRDVLLSAERIS
jgi:hypothetical protein